MPASERARRRRSEEPLELGGAAVESGEVRHLQLPLTEVPIRLPVPMHVSVIRGRRPGPRIFVTAGVHADELNGIEIARRISYGIDPAELAGDLICVPIVNVPGFLARSRYLPDGSDLNRFFPGSTTGKPAARLAYQVMREIVSRCDYGVDLHTAARGRANVPHVRGDMDEPEVRQIAKAFGTTIVVHKRGHRNSLRRVATQSGVPTIVLEAGETGRIQRPVGDQGVQGVRNVLHALGMLDGDPLEPPFQVIVRNSVWVRAQHGGLLELVVAPGDLVYQGQEIGTNTNPFGPESQPITAPITGLVVGVSISPVCEPGSPLCHIVRLEKTLPTVEKHLQVRSPD